MVVAVDWDGTLVDTGTQEWLPGALDALRTLKKRGCSLVIFTCRATWPEGLASVEAKLAQTHLRIPVTAVKPEADFYVDNKNVLFDGDWQQTLRTLRSKLP